jgi:hypothetical protein
MSSIVILGLPKTGTSALYAAIKQERDFLAIYEVGNERQLDYLRKAPAEHKLVKLMYPKLFELGPGPGVEHRRAASATAVDFFDKKILIVRDARDMLISWLLYRPFQQRNFDNAAFTDEFVAALEAKERAPGAVSVQQLYGVLDRHAIAYTRRRDFQQHFELGRQLRQIYPDLFVVRYEDFVDDNLDPLREYLGIDVKNKASLGAHATYNERSKSYGGWRDWFTPSDVDHYRPTFRRELMQFGYDTDWTLAADPVIDPATSSQYVRRNLERVRKYPRQYGDLRKPEVYSDEYIRVLRSAVEDGAEGAMIELALAHLHGLGVRPDAGEALRLLIEADARGNPLAMVHLGFAHTRGVCVPQDKSRAKDFFARAAAIRGKRRVKKTMRHVAPLWNRRLGCVGVWPTRPWW